MKKADNFNPGQWLIENKLTTNSKILKEAKQVGTLYHFTWLAAFQNILADNILGNEDELYRTHLSKPNNYGRVSLTRDKDFNKKSALIRNTSVCIVLDGDKLSENNQIKPYQWDPSHFWDKKSKEYKQFLKKYGDNAFEDQMEETIPIIKNLDKYIIKVIIYKDNIEFDPVEEFEPEDFQEIYEECINLLKSKNIPYEIK